jgi:uncharacterized RDD family membrane protein YckC
LSLQIIQAAEFVSAESFGAPRAVLRVGRMIHRGAEDAEIEVQKYRCKHRQSPMSFFRLSPKAVSSHATRNGKNAVSQINPYASPTIANEPKIASGSSPNASQNRRFFNLIVDNAILQVLSFAAGLALRHWYLPSDGTPIYAQDLANLRLMVFFFGLFVGYTYYFLLEAVCQKTIAKMFTGTKVVNMDGSRPSIGQFAGRAAARFIPFEAFSFLGSQEPRGWHDALTRTRVIRG